MKAIDRWYGMKKSEVAPAVHGVLPKVRHADPVVGTKKSEVAPAVCGSLLKVMFESNRPMV